MHKHGKLDPRDRDVHAGDAEAKKMVVAGDWDKKSNDEESAQAGAECWLLFVAFDILYVNGDGAKEFLENTVSSHVTVSPGSIVDLDGFERKKILYRVLDPQPKEVEIVQTCIVRPNGRRASGEKYFHPINPIMECGHPAYELDSVACAISGKIDNLAEIDAQRRNGRSDEQISKARALCTQMLYDSVVEEQREEGLLFKDLNGPYILGEASRAYKYWYKFKPDYYGGSVASDLDVVIIGAYFATGLRMSGRPSALLCACVDSDDHHSFFPVCKVNLGSVPFDQARQLLEATGFRENEDGDKDDMRDKWFRGNRDTKTMPDFISHKASPDDTEGRGWRVPKKDCKCLPLFL